MDLYSRGLIDLKGAVPVLARGLEHMAPTYVVGSRGRCPTAFVARTLLLLEQVAWLETDRMTAFDKPALRAAALATRAAIATSDAKAFAERLAHIGLDLARGHGADVVSVFASIGDEIDTMPLMHALAAAGFRVVLPVSGKRGTALTFRRWTPETILVPGRMAIPEPPETAEVLEPDLLFVPLAAFDRRGHRIGYGAGFYDRTLAALRAKKIVTAVGLAYAAQETLFIPSEAHDEPLDFVVTEKDTILCADGG